MRITFLSKASVPIISTFMPESHLPSLLDECSPVHLVDACALHLSLALLLTTSYSLAQVLTVSTLGPELWIDFRRSSWVADPSVPMNKARI